MASSYRKRKALEKVRNVFFKLAYGVYIIQSIATLGLTHTQVTTRIILIKFILCLPMLLALWIILFDYSIISRLVNSVFLILASFASLILSHKALATFEMVLFLLIGIFLLVLLFFKNKCERMDVFFPSICLTVLFISMLYRCGDLITASKKISFKLVWVPLIMGIVIGVFVAIKFLWKIDSIKESLSERIAIVILCAFICFTGFITYANQLNYVLDTSPPQKVEVVIEKKIYR